MSVKRRSAFTFLTGSIVALGLDACATTSELPSMGNAFSLTSSTFKDGTMLATKNAGNIKTNPNCIGDNVSPPLSWSNVPEGTKSFARCMFDPEGRGGLGVSHWVCATGIPVSTTGFAEGETSQLSDKYVPGKGTAGLGHYLGPVHSARHGHASLHFHADRDRPRTQALPPGLTRDELFAKLAGHIRVPPVSSDFSGAPRIAALGGSRNEGRGNAAAFFANRLAGVAPSPIAGAEYRAQPAPPRINRARCEQHGEKTNC